MAQSSSDYIRGVAGQVVDSLTFGPQRRAAEAWVSDKEDRLKRAYQSALTKLEPPTRYDYSKSKLVSSTRKVAAPRRARVARAKVPAAKKRYVGKEMSYGQ